MRISPKPLLALRNSVLVGWFLCWNAAFLLAMFLNNFRPPEEGPGRWIVLAALAVTSSFSTAIMVSERFRESLLEPSRRELYRPAPFLLIAALTCFLFVELAMT